MTEPSALLPCPFCGKKPTPPFQNLREDEYDEPVKCWTIQRGANDETASRVMIRYDEMTPERLSCLKAIEAAGGRTGHSSQCLAPFCDDGSTLTHPDIFNQCHDAGWLVSSHDDRTDESFVTLTAAGKEALTSTYREDSK